MIAELQYGENTLPLDLEALDATVIEPRFIEGLADERSAFQNSVRAPIESPPLRELIGADDQVAVVISDITRPLPSERLLPWLFNELNGIPKENFTIIVGTGSHRKNTLEELISMVGREVAENYRIVNHDGHDRSSQAYAGESVYGYPVYFNREYVAADKRIILGFIEPHFMAGFSGGYKAVFPGVANIEAIMQYHGVENIGHRRSTWGVLQDNPTQNSIRAAGSLLPVDFCINVTINSERGITGCFCGETLAAHAKGCEFARETAMVACEDPFPIVVTTNSGAPLDLNLYQAVKGMSAGAEIVQDGGLVLIASQCNDGFPEHGNFRKQLFSHESPQAIMDTLNTPGFSEFDQWQCQMLVRVLERARVGVYSELPDEDIRGAFMFPVHDIRECIDAEINKLGGTARVAVLPEGPQTIPYLRDGE